MPATPDGLRAMLRPLVRRVPVLVDVRDAVRSPRRQARLAADLARTWRESRFIRDATFDGSRGRVLFPALTENAYEIKLQMMLALGLRLRGWQPTVLVGGRHLRWVRRYWRTHGVNSFVDLERFRLTPDERALCRRAAARLLRGPMSFQDVKAWAFQGSRLGPQILSTVSRQMMEGAPDPRDPEVAGQIERLLPATLERIVRAQKVMEEVSPALAVVIEANYATYGAIVDAAVAAGCDVIQVTQPWRDDALMCRRLTPDTRRQHPSSVAPTSLARLAERPWSDQEERELQAEFGARYGGAWFLQGRNQPGTRPFDRDGLVRHLRLATDRPIAAIFSHVLWDANLFYGDDLFEDYGDWFVQTVSAAAENSNVSWLVKIHPANVWKRAQAGMAGEYSEVRLLREAVGALPAHVRLVPPDSEISTLSLFQHADYGVTVRGTAGMEMACFGKPVLTAGTGRYSGLGFTIDAGSVGEYLENLAKLHTLPPLTDEQTIMAKRHAHAVFRLRHWPMHSFHAVFEPAAHPADPLAQNLRCAVASLADLRERGDLGKWARWAGESDEVDYIDGR